MIASLADHGIARTRRGFGPAGCFAGRASGAPAWRASIVFRDAAPVGARTAIRDAMRLASIGGGAVALARTAAQRAMLGLGAVALAAAGCGLLGGPVVTVENRSPWRVDSLWVVTTADSARVPAMAPGATARVRVRAQGEDLLLLRGRASGSSLAPSMGTYVEGGRNYRVRAVVGKTGAVTITDTRVGGTAY